jgi:hypothetical protein
MTATVSFFPLPAPQSSTAANSPAPAAGKSSSDAPFSRMLDHAVRENPARKNKPAPPERSAARSAKGGVETKSDRAERKLESESRPARVKDNKHEREAAESLASACSVAAPTTPTPEEPTVPEGEVVGEAVRVATGLGTTAAEVGSVGKAGTATTASDPNTAIGDAAKANSEMNLASLLTPTEAEAAAGTSTTAAGSTVSDEITTSAAGSNTDGMDGTESLVAPTHNPADAVMPVEMPVDQTQVAGTETPAPAIATEPISPANTPEASVIQSAAGDAASETSAPSDGTSSPATALAASGANEAAAAAPDEVRRSVRAVRRARQEALENAAGIGGAKSSETMKTAIKKEELAGGTEQFLPVSSPNALSALRNLPGELNRRLTGPASTALESAAGGGTNTAPNGVSSDTDALFVRSANPMARISEIVSREIRMFKRGGDDLVEVVLTPDAKTQISLRLQWRDGQVEVQARCDLGDYQSLNTQWPHLQASLAGHGVRLSHLSERVSTGFTEFFNNPSFAQQRGREEQSHHPASSAEALPPLAAPAPKSGGTPGVRRSNRLFDSWA